MNQIYKLFQAGRLEEAEILHQTLMPLYRGLFKTTNPIPIKAVLNQMGMEVGSLRLPLVDLNQFESLELYQEIKDLIDE